MSKFLKLVIISLFICTGIFAQDQLSFEKVINVDSIQKIDIYNGIREWIGMNYVSAKSVIEIDDKDAGLIILRPKANYSIGKLQYMCYDGTIAHTIKIQIKDGKFKVIVTNFTHQNNPGNKVECQLGVINTSEEYDGISSWGYKGPNNKIWKDLKIKSKIIADNTFSELEKIKFSSVKSNGKNDTW